MMGKGCEPWTTSVVLKGSAHRGGSRGRQMEAYHCRVSLRRPGSVLLAAWFFAAAGAHSRAQSPAVHRDGDTCGGAAVAMPDAPALRAAEEPAGGVICGTVLDTNGTEVEGATVVLEGA